MKTKMEIDGCANDWSSYYLQQSAQAFAEGWYVSSFEYFIKSILGFKIVSHLKYRSDKKKLRRAKEDLHRMDHFHLLKLKKMDMRFKKLSLNESAYSVEITALKKSQRLLKGDISFLNKRERLSSDVKIYKKAVERYRERNVLTQLSLFFQWLKRKNEI